MELVGSARTDTLSPSTVPVPLHRSMLHAAVAFFWRPLGVKEIACLVRGPPDWRLLVPAPVARRLFTGSRDCGTSTLQYQYSTTTHIRVIFLLFQRSL